ncbi:YpiF family protein [Shimazuella sp. AN120528]|uniref:DUF2487 family protein n=1 Tax=Shimazuella soli TaxID=1892854 RepID=UPI001F10EE9B|nr:DUF2487 family protein [Shimazuella soli]MCH5585460.1 YpiF family protein [Shimazuella soli]
MRLLEQNETNWTSIAPYLDTVCLPVYQYRMVHKELQLEEANLIEYITEELEKKLIGRMLLLPACSLIGRDEKLLQTVITSFDKELVHSGFHYRFLVILEETWGKNKLDTSFHLLSVQKDVDKEVELERLYEEILHIWQSV